jgi:ABC-2 type transport system permease protein
MKSLTIILNTVYESITRLTLLFYLAFGTIILLVITFGVRGVYDDGMLIGISFFGNEIPVIDGIDPSGFIFMATIGGSMSAILLLGVFATASILPETLRKGTIDIYLSKPISRLELLLSKYMGAISAIAVALIYFMVGLFLIIGLKTGIWNTKVFPALGLIILMFGCIQSMSTLAGVLFRNMGLVLVFVYIHLFLFSPFLRLRKELVGALTDNAVIHRILDGFYYALPQLSEMQERISFLFAPAAVEGITEFSFTPFSYSLLSCAVMLLLAYVKFKRSDY